MKMDELKVLAPTAILGYGFPKESFAAGMNLKPHVIAVDAGSTDPGPYYLGAGVSFTNRKAVKRDLELMISAALEENIPLIIGSAGGSGGDPHLKWNVDIIREIAAEKNITFRMAIIEAQIDKELVRNKLLQDKVHPFDAMMPLSMDELDKAVRIVGQMGIEPFIRALELEAQIIVAGRAYDPAIFAALAVKEGYDRGLALHMGKILECASIACVPGSGSDCIMGFLGENYFRIESLNPDRKCTVLSIAAHTLYEKSNPYVLPGPGGILDLQETKFEQETDTTVKVSCSKFISAKKYTIKLEGVKRLGYRTISVSGTRDPIMIKEIDNVIEGVRERVKDNFSGSGLEYHLDFKIYGKNGVMGAHEPVKDTLSHELGIIIEAIATEQATADAICSFARSTMLHFGYEGRISTAGNLAFPYSPSDFKAGEVYDFNVYHIMEVDDPLELFPIRVETVNGGKHYAG